MLSTVYILFSFQEIGSRKTLHTPKRVVKEGRDLFHKNTIKVAKNIGIL